MNLFVVTWSDLLEALQHLGVHEDESLELTNALYDILDEDKVVRRALSFKLDADSIGTGAFDAYENAERCLRKALCLHLMKPEHRRLWDRAFREKETLEQALPENETPPAPGGRARL